MSDQQPKTYFILPMTNYGPGDLIQLGQVIKDPMYPFQRIAPPLALKGKLQPRKSKVKEFAATNTKTRALSVGLASHVLNALKWELSARESSKRETFTWDAVLLETHFFEPDEDLTFVNQLQQDSQAVRQWLRKVRLPGKSAFVITGLKIAVNPGTISCTTSCTTFDEASLKAQLAAISDPQRQVTMGARAESSRFTSTTVTGNPTESYVFAYQLRKIKVNPVTGSSSIGTLRMGGEVYGGGGDSEPEEDDDEEFDSSDEDDDGPPKLNDKLSLDTVDFGLQLPDTAFRKQKINLSSPDSPDESYLLVSTV